MGRIRNTAELRGFLAEAMEEIRAGKMQPHTAQALTAVAGRINESLKLEVDMMKAAKDMKQIRTELGQMQISSAEAADAKQIAEGATK